MSPITVRLERDILKDARAAAQEFREEMTRRGTLVVNLMSSPGSGKTSLLEKTAQHWGGRMNSAVLVGDLETDRDAVRLAKYVPAAQLTTGGACHLELPLVRRGLEALGDPDLQFLFIENVGNLVCPASHDLGEHLRVILLSVPEGDDKPGKYPKAFRTSQMMLVTKVDLLPYLPFSVDAAVDDALRIQPGLRTLSVSAVEGIGIAEWCDYLEQLRNRMLETSHASSCDL